METCSVCQKEIVPSGCGTGYGIDSKTQAKICYACIGERERNDLLNSKIGDRFTFYYSGGEVMNWSNSLTMTPYWTRTGHHNWGLKRVDVWFRLEGRHFWGYIIGSDTEILHVRRIK